MAIDVVSKHLRSSTELQLLVPVRNGFVEGTERLTSFATRLKLLLEALSDSFRVAWDRDRLLTTGPIDQLRTIQATQWGVREQPEGSLLLVSSCFDRSWEEYFHLLVDRTGPLLDAIFMHCDGFEGKTTAQGYERFAKFIRKNQVQNSFFYMAAPDLSVDDLRRARKVLSGGHFNAAPIGSLEDEARRTRAERAVEDSGLEPRLARSLRMAVTKLLGLAQLFPKSEKFDGRSARDVFDGAAYNLLAEYLTDAALETPVLRGLPPAEDTWLKALVERESKRSAEAAQRRQRREERLTLEQLKSIQGNILEPYNVAGHKIWHACLVLVQCDDAKAVRGLLERVKEKLSSAAPCSVQDDHCHLNLAFSYNGLRRLDLSEAVLAELPAEFREGMEARAGLVGDVGFPNYPDFWQRPSLNWPAPRAGEGDDGEQVALSSVDVVFLLQLQGGEREAYDAPWSNAHPLCKEIEALDLERDDTHVLHVQLLRRHQDSHFKLPSHGESQPVPQVTLAGRDLTNGIPERDRVPLGELLLGYHDSRGSVSLIAEKHAELFKDGTFLVLRKLEQDVQAFDTYLRENAALGDPDTIRGLVLGRDRDGNPLVAQPPKDARKNNFSFDDGVEGRHCPLHSHIRRTNPRPGAEAEQVPRIMRRSIPYGPSEQAAQDANAPAPERGLMFMAYNANIASQFEILQRWINGANSTGLPSTQNDLLSGVLQPTGTAQYVYQNGQWLPLKQPSKPFVKLRWGLYLFVPSLDALKLLAGPRAKEREEEHKRDAAEAVKAGSELSARLNKLDDKRARDAWKQVIEGGFSEQNRQIWAATCAGEGPHRAKNYGTLIGTEQKALDVLGDQGQRFSVREYYRRLGETIGPNEPSEGNVHYLAHDPAPAGPVGEEKIDQHHQAFLTKPAEPGYGALSELPNKYIGSLWGRPQLFERAHDHVCVAIGKFHEQKRPVFFPDVIKEAVANLAHELVGISEDEARRIALLENFILVSRYAFQPYPDEVLRERAISAGRALRGAYLEYRGPMQDALPQSAYPYDRISAAIGAIVGFAAPAVGSLVSALSFLLQTGELYRVQTRIRRAPEQLRMIAGGVFERVQLSMPIPPLLYRSALPGAPHGKPGEYVVVGLSSVAREAKDKRQWLFGGHRGQLGENKPHHGCPASDPAFTMMSGILACFLRLPNVSPVSRVHITFRGELPSPLLKDEAEPIKLAEAR